MDVRDRLGLRLRGMASPEIAAAALLLLATVAALVWANSPVGDTYATFWHTDLSVELGRFELSLSLMHWVNDGLMAIFFFVVGLEVKRELVLGELADRRRAMVPIFGAIAGLIVPALVYLAINRGGDTSAWGTVISTDTAFLIGVVALLSRACPPQLRMFLLALAVVDDIGALSVIAIFYTDDLRFWFLLAALGGIGLMFALRWLRVWRGPAYLVLAIVSWVMLYESGVHATLLGVAIAFCTPAYRPRRNEVMEADRRTRTYLQDPRPANAHAARLAIEQSVPPGERLQRLWRPWSDYVIVPLFALANAGVVLGVEALKGAVSSPITIGVIIGLVVGKPVGILLGSALAIRLNVGELAPGLTKSHMVGGALLSGIGFTISLLIVELAVPDPLLADEARVGILVASSIAAAAGYAALRLSARRTPVGEAHTGPLEPPVDPARDHIRGPADAPLTLVGFGDFEADFQGWGAIGDLRERLGDQLRYVYRHVPHPQHPNAFMAAEAVEAAGAQGRFWEMHDRLFQSSDRLSPPDLVDHATALGLDVARFAEDLGSGRFRERIDEDIASARASEVAGSHTFFVNGQLYSGPHDADSLAAALLDSPAAGRVAMEPDAPGDAPAAPKAGDPLEEISRLPEDLEETPDSGGDHPRLTDEQLARFDAVGERRRVERGDLLYRPGDDGYDFYVVVSGAVAIVGYVGAVGRRVVRVHGARRFLGALDLLREHNAPRTAVVIRSGEVLRIPVEQFRTLLAGDDELRDLVVRAYMRREVIARSLVADLLGARRPG